MGELVALPGMLTLARESRGWTQADLSGEMTRLAAGETVSQGYVSRAEAGRLVVKDERLALFAAALRYTPEMLCRTTDINGVGVGLIHHRKRASLGALALRRVHATLSVTRLQVEAIATAAHDDDKHRFRSIAVDDVDTPADAAETLRLEWGLPSGPVANLVEVLESAGALLVLRDLQTRELDGVSQWSRGDRPLFLLNSSAPADRFRFSLAHELGHIVMHAEPGDARLQERQADQFAAEFLMPHESILPDLQPGLDLSRLMKLKSRWRVSMAALAFRAKSLGVLSEWQYRSLTVEMSALGYRTKEPGPFERETPRHLADAVTRLTRQHHLDLSQAAHLAGLELGEFCEIYSCPSSIPVTEGSPVSPTGR
ncbi:ImmA/IrrE family metallo-endopeptidase [Streptomyces sp. NPDC059618]|uniref:ImmA/IrrE family metallo-endopeptidase n=1 Tax=Streptomyces sp. NPDC059618 TaxID=3346887 RepID=UPI003697441C